MNCALLAGLLLATNPSAPATSHEGGADETSATGTSAASTEAVAPADAMAHYGAGISAGDVLAVADLLAAAATHVDRTVRVEGTVTDVCPRRGCWVELAGPGGGDTVRVKVPDGEIVFPAAAVGKSLRAEGTWRRHELPHDDAVAYARHLADEKGETFDPASVDPGPMVFYQVEGTGAEIW